MANVFHFQIIGWDSAGVLGMGCESLKWIVFVTEKALKCLSLALGDVVLGNSIWFAPKNSFPLRSRQDYRDHRKLLNQYIRI